jgi:hypothetical protein
MREAAALYLVMCVVVGALIGVVVSLFVAGLWLAWIVTAIGLAPPTFMAAFFAREVWTA